MRVVLDTNVLVSALLTPHGRCAQVLDLVIEGIIVPCVDDRITSEYHDVLARAELGFDAADRTLVLEAIRTIAEPFVALPLPAGSPDPDDLPFIEVAHAASALLVTGNLKHFPPDARHGVVVVSPAELIALLTTVDQ